MSFRNMFKKKKVEGFYAKYDMEAKPLGSGQFADVYRGWAKADPNTFYAVKVIMKSKLTTPADEEGLKFEIQILKDVNHHGIIQLFDVFETEDRWYLVTELAKGGELFDRIVAKTKDGAYSEKEGALIVMQIAESLKYCHDLKIVHRDLKPENLLLEDDSETEKVKLADFGFAAYCHEKLSDGCGTLVYVAPEVLKGEPYQTSPDMWSLGVITYILLCGYPPFFDPEQGKLMKKIIRGRYKFRAEDWDNISNDAKDFIRGLLKRQPENRMTAGDALNHPWITNYAKLSSAGLNIETNLRKFQAQMLLKKALMGLRAFDKLQEALKNFDETAPLEGEAPEDEGNVA